MTIVDIHRMRKFFEESLCTEMNKGHTENEKVEELLTCLKPLWAHIQAYNNIIKSKNRIVYESKMNIKQCSTLLELKFFKSPEQHIKKRILYESKMKLKTTKMEGANDRT